MEGIGDPFNRAPFREGSKSLHQCYMQLAALRRSAVALSTGRAVFMADNSDVLLVLRYITDGKDIFGEACENSVWLCVINRGETARDYSADCSEAGLGVYTGTAAPLSGEIIRLS